MPGQPRSGGAGRGVGKGGQGGRAGKAGSHRKGAAKGSGGQGRQALEGRKATPPAEQRPGHPAARRAAAAAQRAASTSRARRTGAPDAPELLVGRNPVVEAVRAKVPATAVYLAVGLAQDERLTEIIALTGKAGIPLLEVSRAELDRLTAGILHQGVALQVPPFAYDHPDDLLARALQAPQPLVVALDGVTDPRNLGAVVRSAAAFGAQGVLVPERRAAGMTAVAWRTSAGAAARLPVARCTNLARTLRDYKQAGMFVVGLDAEGTVQLDDLAVATSPLVVVVGSEGKGLGRLVAETCDLTVAIAMSGPTESLNASVAAAVTLAEVSRRRRTA